MRNYSANKPMTTGIRLNDSTGALRSVTIRANVKGCGVTTDVLGTNLPATVRTAGLASSAAC
jgi:hypothetical protein